MVIEFSPTHGALKMKYLLLLSISLTSLNAFASSCNDAIESFFAKHAPNTKEILITGKYTEKSEKTDMYLDCEVPVKKEATHFKLNIKPEKFNPNYGDGGAFWPFGNYPTVEQESDNYRSVNYYTCSADENGFSIDFSYNELSGWYKSYRYSLSVLRNTDGEFELSLRDGDGGLFASAVSCKGSLSENSKQ